ncbi:hypothetical protein ON010_g14510 [Phytophthora cinnamomi]|nr:hypothetical protein ON010_g14510 [Phytophthora cinnamomi]
MGNKPSGLRSSSRADEANAMPRVAASGPSTATAEYQQQGEPSGPVAKLLTGNIASIRPVEQMPRAPTALDQKITNALRERWEARAHHDKDKYGLSRTGSNSNPAIATQSILFGEGNKLRLAFQLAVDAFLWFDVDGDGIINRSEMSTKLQNSMALHSPTKRMTADDMSKDTSDDSSNQAIWEQRFMEMDWNGDGTIQFKEFLMAFESWVGLEDDDSMSTNSFRYAAPSPTDARTQGQSPGSKGHADTPETVALARPQRQEGDKAFSGVRTTFKEYDKEGHGYVEYDDLPAIYKELGVSFSEDEINQVFDESDMKENGKLNFKELLISLAIGFLLHRIPSLEKNRLSVFYTSRSGSIGGSISGSVGRNNSIGGNSMGGSSTSSTAMAMNGDLEASMARHSPTKKLKRRSGGYRDSGEDSKNWSIWERRFAEMDWNHNGMIHFNEFLMAFESWVGVDDDDDEEDDDETRHETEKETSTAMESTTQ